MRLLVIVSALEEERQMNAGALVATGDGFLLLHADTRLPPEAGSVVAAALADPGIVGGRFDVRLEPPLLRIVAGLIDLRSRLTRIATGDQVIFVRRAVAEWLGGSRTSRSRRTSLSRARSSAPDGWRVSERE